MTDLTYPAALGAGALSFLSPCVLPLVPPYLCYMAGVSMEELQSGEQAARSTRARRQVLLSAVLFVLGFTTVFVCLGAGASSMGRILRENASWLSVVAGIAIIAMGLNFLGVFRIAFLSREARFRSPDRSSGLVAPYLMGLAFAFGWTPCIGPVLGAILGMAGSKDTLSEGATLLGVYSLGLGIPFILAAAFSGAFLAWAKGFRRHLGKVEKAMGALLVVTGILFLTGGMQSLSFWLLETFPGLQTIG
jgi:cytochrome c-type biogenesis protein